jgi:plasmid stabilization system protein ParE
MGDRYSLRIMPEAAANLVSIHGYIERESPQNAALAAERLIAAIDSLQDSPLRFKVHQSRRDPTRTVRAMSVPPWIIYYRVRTRDLVVEVLTVRHGARRQPRKFD